MGRPIKTKVTETSADAVQAVVTRVAKKLKTFNTASLQEAVNKAFQKDQTPADVTALTDAVKDWLNGASTYTVTNGTYTAIAGRRGRPKKVVAAQAAK